MSKKQYIYPIRFSKTEMEILDGLAPLVGNRVDVVRTLVAEAGRAFGLITDDQRADLIKGHQYGNPNWKRQDQASGR